MKHPPPRVSWAHTTGTTSVTVVDSDTGINDCMTVEEFETTFGYPVSGYASKHTRMRDQHRGAAPRRHARARQHRTRRHVARSTSSADPGDSPGDRPRRSGELRHIRFVLAAFLRSIGGAR